MIDQNVPAVGQNDNPLAISPVEGEPRIRDLDLAVRLSFAKSTKIRDLIKRHRASLEAMGPLPTVERVINGGEATEFYLNRKQAIFITAKSETAEATDITIEIIEKFDAYERGAVQSAPLPDFDDPRLLQTLLVEHLGKRIEAEKRAVVAEKRAEAAATTVAAFDRIAKSDGSLCITDAAKDLQIRRKDLFAYLRTNGWIYSRPGKSGNLAYQAKIQAGYLEHKVTTLPREDGTDRIVEQVRVTPKGLAKLAMIVPGAQGVNGHEPGHILAAE